VKLPLVGNSLVTLGVGPGSAPGNMRAGMNLRKGHRVGGEVRIVGCGRARVNVSFGVWD
jgi:hypothetical protein